MKIRSSRAHVVSSLRTPGLLAVAAGSVMCFAFTAVAGPEGAQVSRGNVSIDRNGSQTIIRASDGSIINYRSFDIGANESVRFIQPNAEARVLNRINSAAPTRIDGALTANGRVYLVNPAGVFFGKNSVVDASRIYAAAGNISDSDFIRGTNQFTQVTGSVINEGSLAANQVHLVGANVSNAGVIVADRGVVTMSSGNDILIRDRGSKVSVRINGQEAGGAPASGTAAAAVTNSAPAVENTGAIKANKGVVSLGAGDVVSLAIRNTGDISAAGGNVSLNANDGTVANAGSISTNVQSGTAGMVAIVAPHIVNTGTITAIAQSGTSGSVTVTSSRSTAIDSGLVSVAGGGGVANGGTLLIHSFDGNTSIGKLATIDMSGGELGGNGATGEISAKGSLGIMGTLLGDTVKGYAGAKLLLDPRDIFIELATDLPEGASSLDQYITPGAIEGFAGDMTLLADRDVVVRADVNKTNGALTLQAGQDIRFEEAAGEFLISRMVSATELNLIAARDMVDTVLLGTTLRSTVGDVNLTATTGEVDFGFVSVPDNKWVRITQARSRYFGAGPGGLVINPERTNVKVDVTDGWLVLGGDYGGISGYQKILCLEASGSEYVRVEDDIDATDCAMISSRGDVLVDGFIHSNGPVELNAGLGGSGAVRFLSSGLSIWGSEIALIGGTPLPSLGSGTVDALTNSPSFAGPGGSGNPSAFKIAVDGDLTDAMLPNASQFAGGTAGLNYTLQSFDKSVAINDASKVAGSNLRLVSTLGAGSNTIGTNLSLASLVSEGLTNLGGNVTTTGNQTYNGPAILTAPDVALIGNAITIDGLIEASTAGGSGLTATSTAGTTFTQSIGQANALAFLSVNGPLTFGKSGSSSEGMVVRTVGDQSYGGPVTLADSVSTTALGATSVISFLGTVDSDALGAKDLMVTVQPDGLIRFGGAIGRTNALDVIELCSDGGTGSRSIPTRATIIGLNGFDSVSRDFIMCPYEKLTALGDLSINASREARLGDLNSAGNMLVSAPAINLQLRPASSLVLSDGTLVDDEGLDFVSGGTITFNGTVSDIPSPTGTGTKPLFGNPSGVATGVDGYSVYTIDPSIITVAALTETSNGRILDQRVLTPIAPPPPPPPPAFSGFVDPRPYDPRFRDSVIPTVYDLDLLRRVAIDGRGVAQSESQGNAQGGRYFYDNLSGTLSPDGLRLVEAAATRFDLESVSNVVRRYDTVFGTPENDRRDQVRELVTPAARQYMSLSAAGSIGNGGPSFASYLNEAQDGPAAMATLMEVGRMLRDLRNLGLTPGEFAAAKAKILSNLVVDGSGVTINDMGRMIDELELADASSQVTRNVRRSFGSLRMILP